LARIAETYDLLRATCRQQTHTRRLSFLRCASGKRLPHPPPAPDLSRTANLCTADRSLLQSSFARSLSGPRSEGVGRTEYAMSQSDGKMVRMKSELCRAALSVEAAAATDQPAAGTGGKVLE
jgi:hypothetical protein